MKLRLVVITLAILLAVPAFADIVLFDDGAIDGQTNSFFIDGPNPGGPYAQSISNGFVAIDTASASYFTFGMWVPTGTTPATVTWWLGTSPFASDLGTATVNNPSYTEVVSNNQYGYDVYELTITGLTGTITAGQTYWLSLGNANDNQGTQFDGWDLNLGPAQCQFSQGGVNYGDCGAGGGNAFTLYGTPEPGTLVMLGGGILAAAGALRRKIGF